ncbi:MAG: carboxylesterase family protein [Lachnospiraceae bacterium]|nr:carboxylesterase family protein [Robinsoniella sp.]MDY3767439.1 carboxylesterase family protein [Lachnospiraceae bacterium]
MKKWRCVVAATTAAMATMAAMPVMAAEYDANNPPIVTTEKGQLMGFMDEDTYTFLGIPYAQAERFQEPQEVEAWEGVKSAQTYGTISPIPDQTSVGSDEMMWPHRYWIQNENCMNLNVWTQSLDTSAKKPVLVFFHGGGYTNGSSVESAAYDGKNLSEYGDVVVVTVNHRLNVLGFLDLTAYGDEYAGSSNLGIKDLVASLEWVQENIEYFGGDPDNVTIFGQSGGGGKVTTLMRTPAAEGLFDKAICQSGIFGGTTKESEQEETARLLEQLGLDETQVDELKTMNYHDLIEAAQAAGLSWNPENDGEYILDDYCDWANDIPFMASTVFSEFDYNWMVEGPNKNEWTEEESMARLTEKYGDKAEAIAEEFQKVFPGRNIADAYFYDAYLPWAAISREGVEGILNHKLENATAPVYEYLFDYEVPVNGGALAFHCCDLIYVFHNVDIPVVTRATGGDETAHKVQDEVASAIVAFATTGDPSTESLEWKAYTQDEKNIMVFSADSKCTILNDEQLYTLAAEAMNN